MVVEERQSGKTWEREEYDQICLSLKLVLNNEKKNSKRKHNININICTI